MAKTKWVVEKEGAKKTAAQGTIWLFGVHAVKDALANPAREKKQLVVTRNAAIKLADVIAKSGIDPQICDPRKFSAPLDPGSVHQGAALEVKTLIWGNLADYAAILGKVAPRLLLLDQVSDPQNVGAILRSAEVFGVNARPEINPRETTTVEREPQNTKFGRTRSATHTRASVRIPVA